VRYPGEAPAACSRNLSACGRQRLVNVMRGDPRSDRRGDLCSSILLKGGRGRPLPVLGVHPGCCAILAKFGEIHN
jgi:hypothetical protein